MICRNCHEKIKPGMKFCSKCGAKAPEEEERTITEQLPAADCCKVCGSPLSPDLKFCMECGAAVQAEAKEEESAASQDDAGGIKRCKYCGSPMEQGMRFCLSCGKNVEEKEASPEGGTNQCANCGMPLEPGMLFCLACGAKQTADEREWKQIPPPAAAGRMQPPKPDAASKNKGKKPLRLLLTVLLIVMVFAVLFATCITVFRKVTQENRPASGDTDIVTDATEESLETETIQGEQPPAEQEVTEAPTEAAGEPPTVFSAAPADEPGEAATEPAEAAAPPSEIMTEQQPTSAPTVWEEEEPEEQYTFYLYRKNPDGAYRTGSSSWDVWDCNPENYLWPSDSVRITNADLDKLTVEQIDFVRNEIYARHGYIFVKNMTMKSYFESRTWYSENPLFSTDSFNKIESDNINAIVEYQKAHNQP